MESQQGRNNLGVELEKGVAGGQGQGVCVWAPVRNVMPGTRCVCVRGGVKMCVYMP